MEAMGEGVTPIRESNVALKKKKRGQALLAQTGGQLAENRLARKRGKKVPGEQGEFAGRTRARVAPKAWKKGPVALEKGIRFASGGVWGIVDWGDRKKKRTPNPKGRDGWLFGGGGKGGRRLCGTGKKEKAPKCKKKKTVRCLRREKEVAWNCY